MDRACACAARAARDASSSIITRIRHLWPVVRRNTSRACRATTYSTDPSRLSTGKAEEEADGEVGAEDGDAVGEDEDAVEEEEEEDASHRAITTRR